MSNYHDVIPPPPLQGTLRQAARAMVTAPLATDILTRTHVTVKSPLRYPGGKSRAVKHITGLIPSDLDELVSPFMGGGSVELACASRGTRVHGYDAFEPLVTFWQEALDDAPRLARQVYQYHPLSRAGFYALQKRYFNLTDRTDRAAAFFALNRSSYSGTTLSGGMSPGHPRFTDSAIERLAEFSLDGLTVELADFKDSLARHSTEFLYLDPPYANGAKLYGSGGDLHNGFDHEGLSEILRARPGWVLSYNDCQTVRDLYEGHRFIDLEWSYGMNNSRESNETLILSTDFARVL